MISGNVTGIKDGKEIVRATLDNGPNDDIILNLWTPKPDFENITKGRDHYDYINIITTNEEKDYLDILFDRRMKIIFKKYIKRAGLTFNNYN